MLQQRNQAHPYMQISIVEVNGSHLVGQSSTRRISLMKCNIWNCTICSQHTNSSRFLLSKWNYLHADILIHQRNQTKLDFKYSNRGTNSEGSFSYNNCLPTVRWHLSCTWRVSSNAYFNLADKLHKKFLCIPQLTA